MVVFHILCETQGRPKTWAPRRSKKIWHPSKPILFKLAGLGHGWRVHIADNFRRNSFACENLCLPAPNFRLFPRRLSAPYRLAPRASCSTGPTLKTYVFCVHIITLLSLRYQFKSTLICRAPKLICASGPNMSHTGPVSFVAAVPKKETCHQKPTVTRSYYYILSLHSVPKS
jgi:hypothetical protein